MRKQQKKALTLKQCVLNHSVIFDLLFSSVFIAFSLLVLFICRESLDLFWVLSAAVVCGIPLVILFIPALSNMILIMSGNFYIYIDVVIGRRIEHASSNADDVSKMFVLFATNSFEKQVSHKEYETIKDGTPYYLI